MGMLAKRKTAHATAPITLSLTGIPSSATSTETFRAVGVSIINSVRPISLENVKSAPFEVGRNNAYAQIIADVVRWKQAFFYMDFAHREPVWTVSLAIALLDGSLSADWTMRIGLARDSSGAAAATVSTDSLHTRNGGIMQPQAHGLLRDKLVLALRDARIAREEHLLVPYPFVVQSRVSWNDALEVWRQAVGNVPIATGASETSTSFRASHVQSSHTNIVLGGYRAYLDGDPSRPLFWSWIYGMKRLTAEDRPLIEIAPQRLRYGPKNFTELGPMSSLAREVRDRIGGAS